jgi:deazaflavin-dependent oxidoreductase (nitroreductase family)
MINKYDAPPFQPKWILNAQIFLLRHLRSAFNKQALIITTTGRKTGQRHSVPIGYIPDGKNYLAVNLGSHSNWYLNALANPCVTLEVEGKRFDARVERVPTSTPHDLQLVLDVFARERPHMFKNFFGRSTNDLSEDELAQVAQRVSFMRFYPLL